MQNNNVSREYFTKFVTKYALTRCGVKNVFEFNGKKYAFSTTFESGKIDCRQFYDNCSGLFVYNAPSNTIYFTDKSNITLSKTPTRVSNKGERAYHVVSATNMKAIKNMKL